MNTSAGGFGRAGAVNALYFRITERVRVYDAKKY